MAPRDKWFPNVLKKNGELDVQEVFQSTQLAWESIYLLQRDIEGTMEVLRDRMEDEEFAQATSPNDPRIGADSRGRFIQGGGGGGGSSGGTGDILNATRNTIPYLGSALILDSRAAPEYDPDTQALTIQGAITGRSSLTIEGATALGGTLDVAGATTLADILSVTGAADFQNTVTIDVDNVEALLVRQDGDAGDVFAVDTVTPGVAITGTFSLSGDLTTQGRITIDITDAEAFLVRQDGDTGDIFTVNTTGSIVTVGGALNVSGAITGQGALTLDLDSAEALLVRANGDGGDVLTVNTVTPTVTVTGILAVTGASSFGGLVTVNNDVLLAAAALGNDVRGRLLTVERNTNGGAEGPAPGIWELEAADGVSAFFWVDDDGDIRINTAAATGSTGTPTVDANTAGFKISPREIKQFGFSSPGGGSGTFWAAGFYDAPLTDANLTQASTTQTHGTANHPYYAHAFLVAAAAGTASGGAGAVEIEVSGTSVDDNGVRTAADTEILVADITAMATDQFFETIKKWIGQVTYTLQNAGGSTQTTFAADFNFGFAKYEDAQNTDFEITTFELVGRAGGNDAGFNVELCEHTAVGWTYSAAAFAPGVTPAIVDVAAIWSTESDLINGEHFAFKKLDLSTQIQGSEAEGFLVRVTTTANNAVETMNITVGGKFN